MLGIVLLQTALLVAVAGNNSDKVCDYGYNSYDGFQLLETERLSISQAHALAEAGSTWDFWERPRGGARAVVFAAPETAARVVRTVRDLSLQFQEKSWEPPHRDCTNTRKSRSLRTISFTRFHRLDAIYEYLDDLEIRFPELVTVFSIGSSFEGRDLKVIRISTDNGSSSKPAAFIDAAIHGREWIAPPVALYTVYQLVENYTSHRALVDRMDWYVLPVFNPDGYEYTFTNERFWRKSRSHNGHWWCRGVDINRNFPVHWREGDASSRPCSLTFSGEEELSESEARDFAAFVRQLSPRLRLYLTLHSYGQLLMFPWGFTPEQSEDAAELKEVANLAVWALQSVRGTRYTVGSAYHVLYENSGTSRDWVKKKLGVKYVYTMELPKGGSGFDPPPKDIWPVVVETFEAIKVLGRAAAGILNRD